MSLKAAILWPDTHVSFENTRACNLVLQVMQYLGSDLGGLYLLGDFADFYFASGHGPKHPLMLNTTVKEVTGVLDWLNKFDSLFPTIPKTYIEGNHEHRLARYLQTKAPELFGYVTAQELFEIPKRQMWNWIPYKPDQRVSVLGSKLYARHEPFGPTAKQTAARALCSIAYGHIHKIQQEHIVGLDNKSHIAFCPGWLGNRKSDVFDYIKGHAQWQLGFSIVWVDKKSGFFYPQIIQILEEGTRVSCVVNGKLFRE
jgi:hypothetical protein